MNKNLENGIIKTEPKKWTEENIAEILRLKGDGLSALQISEIIGRSQVSVSIKLKRLTKHKDTYNKGHRADKYAKNKEFFDMIEPKSVLDLYAGNSFYRDLGIKNLITNDTDISFNTNTHVKAFDLLCKLWLEERRFDLIDLDPYGSAAEELSLAIKMARKGLVITLGEMGHVRWKRLDFVSKWWGIDRLEDFTSDNIVREIIKIGKRYRKQLTPVIIGEYNNISRVYFTISEFKETSQWDK